MSRIIVRNLPKNISEEKLRSTFSSRGGIITDLQLKYTPDGRFRQFCFIGFQSDEQAQEALRYFNNTCIQTSRIKVEPWLQNATPIEKRILTRDKNNSKQQIENVDKESNVKDTKLEKKKKQSINEKVNQILAKHKDDPDFQEFLKVHETKWAMWSNDLSSNDKVEEEEIDAAKKNTQLRKKHEIDDEKDEIELQNEEDEGEEKLADKPISDLEYMRSLVRQNNSPTGTKISEKNDKITLKLKKSSNCVDSDLFTIKIHNIAYRTKRQDIINFFKPLKPLSIRIPAKAQGFCYVGFKTRKEMDKAMLKSKSFIKGKQVFLSDFTEKNKLKASNANLKRRITEKTANSSASNAEKNIDEINSVEKDTELSIYHNKWKKQEESTEKYEDIGESGCIFFRNLTYSVTEEDLESLFTKYGPLAEVYLPIDPITQQIKGFGTVTYVMPEHAVQAFNHLDGTTFHGRLLHLIPGKSWTHGDGEDEEENGGNVSFKQKKAKALKETAQQSHSWNTLFLGVNAVADLMASKFEVEKEHIFDMQAGGSSAAVRLALGETQIVSEMRKFLEENQVCLEAFNNYDSNKGVIEGAQIKRSKNIILVKNLPTETSSDELLEVFRPFGTINRLVLPPQGITAIVDFTVSYEAKKAFKQLAYSQFKSLPLYLEWAPVNTFKDTEQKLTSVEQEKSKDVDKKNDNTVKTNYIKEENDKDLTEMPENDKNFKDKVNAEMVEDNEEQPEENTTLFIRNLNFKTDKSSIYEHFNSLGPIHTIEIAQRRDKKNPQEKVFLGYGFIQFKRKATADQALKTKQFSTIDGNVIELKRSEKVLKTSNCTSMRKNTSLTPQTGTKILVRNIPFQAKVKEVREIFQAFGELRTVRLPLKLVPGETSHHRGFGFVDFVTKADAKKAFEALCHSTHLYGRRLVLEWATLETESDVNLLRKRVAEQFLTHQNKRHLPTKVEFSKSLQSNDCNEENQMNEE